MLRPQKRENVQKNISFLPLAVINVHALCVQLVLLLPLLPLRAQQQDSLPAPAGSVLWTRPGNFRSLVTDELGQLYAISNTYELIKYNREGEELFRYNNSTLGELSQVDAANPFGILLFYGPMQQVVVLDRTLNLWATLDLRQPGLVNVAVAGLSRNNQVWVYDDWHYRLKLLDAQATALLTSDDLRLSLGVTAPPDELLAERNQVLLVFRERGVATFTNLGQFVGWLPIPAGAHGLYWQQDRLLFRLQGGLYCWREREKPIALPLPAADIFSPDQLLDMRIAGDRIFYLTRQGISCLPYMYSCHE